jgi:hypothetical protein
LWARQAIDFGGHFDIIITIQNDYLHFSMVFEVQKND